MKNKKRVIPIILIIIIFVVIIQYNQNICSTEGCYNKRVKGYTICSECSCEAEDCFSSKEYNELYCSYHMKWNSCPLTDEEIEICNALVQDYINQLQQKQTNISEITVTTVIPEVFEYENLSIRYDAVIYNKNDEMKFCTIYLTTDDKGFKIVGLEYNE